MRLGGLAGFVSVLILCWIQGMLESDGLRPFPRRIIVENVKNYSAAGDPLIDVNHSFGEV